MRTSFGFPSASLAILLLLAHPAEAPSQDSQSSEGSLATHPRVAQSIELLDVWAEAELAYGEVPGASLAVIHGQDLLWAQGWGMARPQQDVPAAPETIYSICSISKLFTSVAAMNLWEEGRLALNDRVGRHLDWFDLEVRHEGLPLTLETLLTHSSGLPRESDYPYWSPPAFDFPTRDQIRRRLENQEALYAPQRYFQYSNLGLALAGEVVASVADTPYAAYVRNRVLDPLDLTRTSPSIPWDAKRMARGFSGRTRDGSRKPVSTFEADGIAPAAGYSSTVLDLAEFAAWQFRLLEADSPEVLDPPTLQKMHNVHWVDPDWDVHRGLGFGVWRTDGSTYVGHGGSCPGFRSQLTLQPGTSTAAAFAANANGVNARLFARNAIQLMAPAVEAAEDTTTEPATFPPEFAEYTGNYRTQPWGGEIAVIPWKDGLATVSLPTDDPLEALQELEHQKGDTFRRVRDNGDLAEEIRFRRDGSGRVDALIRHSNAWPRLSDEGGAVAGRAEGAHRVKVRARPERYRSMTRQ